jgi:hypothetical protein
MIQLDNLVKVTENVAPPQLYRYNRFVSATVSSGLNKGYTIGDGLDEMDRIASEVLDGSFRTALSGESKEFRESSSSLMFAMILALLMIYLVLAAQFESFKDPLVVMFTVPLAIAGALMFMSYSGITMNIFSQMGTITMARRRIRSILHASVGIDNVWEPTMDELDVCKTLKENGVTPISVDGVDRWPVQRYLAMMPFRESGNDYIINLRDGKEKMAGDEGKEAATFMKNIGQYFNDGFAATDYATAQSMFLDGKSAMYYIGDWEIAAMQDAYKAGKIDYFYLPTIENGKTDASEFCVNSGIGMAFNAKTFDAKTKDFILYVLDNYGEKYAAKQQMSPIKTELPSDVEFSDLYLRIRDDMDKTGAQFLKPWDTYLDADTNTTMQDNLLLLASGDMSVDDFCKLIDDSIATNAKN